MRNYLRAADAFALIRIIDAAGAREEIKKAAELAKAGKMNALELGKEFIVNIVFGCGNPAAERQFYKLASGLLDIPEKEVETMDVLELLKSLETFITGIDKEAWKDFFSSVAKLI